MIKVVSFDIGGTLLKNEDLGSQNQYGLKELTKLLNLPYENVRDAYKGVFQKTKGNFNELVENFCNRLEKVTLGKGIKRLDNFPFEKSFSLKEIDTSRCSSLEYIEGWTLASLPALTEFAIPASVKEINRFPFNHCNNLTTIIYYGDSPDKIKFLDIYIFYYCPELKNLIVPNAINPDDDGWKTFGNANFTYVGREKPKQ